MPHKMLALFGLLGLLVLSGCASSTATSASSVSTATSSAPESTRPPFALASLTPTQSLPSLNLKPTAPSLYAAPATETAVLAAETAAAGNTPAAATPDTSLSPLTLDDVAAEWTRHDFAAWGLSLSMPSDWESRRMPEAFFFVPPTGGNVQLTVGLQGNAPAELAAMTAMLTEDWTYRTPLDFYTTSITVGNVAGLAIWNTSPTVCADVYLPADGIVRHISVGAVFCNEARDQFNEVGQKVLDTIEVYPPD